LANPVLYLLARFGIGARKARRRVAIAAATQETSLVGLFDKSESSGRPDLGAAGGVNVDDLDSRLRALAQEVAALRDALAAYSTARMPPTEVTTQGDKRPSFGHAQLGRFAAFIPVLAVAAFTLFISVQSAIRARDAASSAELSARNAAVSKETVANIAHDNQNVIGAAAEAAKGEIATIANAQKAATEAEGHDATDQIEKAVSDGLVTLGGAVAGDTDQMKRFQAETGAAVAADQQLLAREIRAAETRMIAAIDAAKGEIATITNTQTAAVEGKGHDQTVQIEKSESVEPVRNVQPVGVNLPPAAPPPVSTKATDQERVAAPSESLTALPDSKNTTDQERVAAAPASPSESPTALPDSKNSTDQERVAAAPASPSEGPTAQPVSTNTTDQERVAAAPASPPESPTTPLVSTNTTDQERAAAAPASPFETLTPPLVSTNTTDREGLAPAPPRTYGLTPAVGAGKTTRQCDAEYAANKAAISALGQTKRAFVASCRAGNETIVQGTALAAIDAENGEIAATNTQTAVVEGKGHDQTVQIEKSISVEPATIEQAGGADLLPPTAPQVATNTTDRKRLAAAPAGGARKMTGQCDAKYAANKAAIKASGQTKRAFVASCQAAVEAKGHDQTVQIEKSISVEPATIEQAVGADLLPRTPPLVATHTTDRKRPAAARPQTYGHTPAGSAGKTTGQCDAEYAASQATIKASGQTKRAFVASCHAGKETIVQGTAAPPPPP
jgi:hypothetical protein